MSAASIHIFTIYRRHRQGRAYRCNDFYELGLTDIIFDPGVRVAYRSEHALQLYTDGVSHHLVRTAVHYYSARMDT